MPVENLFAALHPACVIGYTSTSLVTAKTLYNIPTITIVDILICREAVEHKWLGEEEFKRLFAEKISYNADNFDKLKHILSLIKSNNDGV